MNRILFVVLALFVISGLFGGGIFWAMQRRQAANSDPLPRDTREIHFVPTGRPVMEKMLAAAEITANDVVMDLGCGDGRLVIESARRFGARGFGYDIDQELIKRCRIDAEKAGVSDLVEFHVADIYDLDIRDATVVFLYLLPEMNLKLLPQLQTMADGARVLSHDFEMPGVESDRIFSVIDDQPEMDGIFDATTHTVHLFQSPLLLDPEFEPEEKQFAEALQFARQRGVRFSEGH